MEQIKLMLEEMEKDNNFEKEMQSLIEKGDTGAIVSAAGKKGFSFTQADWQEYIKWSQSASSGIDSKEKLSEEQLEAVSGGSKGSPEDPYKLSCWKYLVGEAEFRDGFMRKACRAVTCKTINLVKGNFRWVECKCRFRDTCVDCWHVTSERMC